MSKETSVWLNQNVLVGFTAKRGNAWHYRASDQGAEPNHYPGAIPVDDVLRRLFHWQAVSAPVAALMPCEIDDPALSGIGPDGVPYRMLVDETRQAMVRPDTGLVMGVFKAGYRGHDYQPWLLDTVATILDDDLSIGSAGLLRQGARAWVQVEMPDSIKTAAGVEFRPNLLACTSFDGSLSTTFKRVVTVVVCDNTMQLALGEDDDGTYKTRHSKHSGMKIGAARDALGIVHDMGTAFAAEIERLTNTTVTDDEFRAIISDVFDHDKADTPRARTMVDNRTAAIVGLWHTDVRVAPWSGTAFGAVQAVNTWAHHVRTVTRGAARAERNMDAAVDGTIGKLDVRVLDAVRARVLAPV